MERWTFEPGHSGAAFCARHMMVSWVRGSFGDVHGHLEFDADDPLNARVEAEIDATRIWSGEADRDAHLRAADFLDVENHPKITFSGSVSELIGETTYRVSGNLTIRGVTQPAILDVHYLGQWPTSYWEGDQDKGPISRAGFSAEARINRQDFGVAWNAPMDKGGLVVSNEVLITIDVEALKDSDMERAGLLTS